VRGVQVTNAGCPFSSANPKPRKFGFELPLPFHGGWRQKMMTGTEEVSRVEVGKRRVNLRADESEVCPLGPQYAVDRGSSGGPEIRRSRAPLGTTSE